MKKSKIYKSNKQTYKTKKQKYKTKKNTPKEISDKLKFNVFTDDVKSEILKLPKHIRDNIHINKNISKLNHSKFSNEVISEEINKLEKIFKKDCIEDISLYDISTETIVDGFVVRKISKGVNIYKTFQGFYTEKDINDFSKNNLNLPSWYHRIN